MWPDSKIVDLLNIEHPIIQAPMASATNPELVAAVSQAGGLDRESVLSESDRQPIL